MSNPGYTIETFNPSAVKFGPVTTNKVGGKSIKILGENGKGLMLTTPSMTTWGLSPIRNKTTGQIDGYSLALQFPSDAYPNEEAEKFRQHIEQLDKVVFDYLMKNSESLFGKQRSRDSMEDNYNSMIKFPKKKDKDGKPTMVEDRTKTPTFNVKLPFYDNKFNMEIFDTQGTCLFGPHQSADFLEEKICALIPKLSKVGLLIQCRGIWEVQGKCGVTWGLAQAVVAPSTQLIGSGHCALPVDMSQPVVPHPAVQQQVVQAVEFTAADYGGTSKNSMPMNLGQTDTNVESSDDEAEMSGSDDEEEEEQDSPVPSPEPEPEPSPKPKAKKGRAVVRTRKTK